MATTLPLYIVHCLDVVSDQIVSGSPRNGYEARMQHYAAHKAYQAETADINSSRYIKKLASGPLVTDDGLNMKGSCFLLEANRDQVDRFIIEDPFSVVGVWASVSINRYFAVAGVQPYTNPV